VTSFSGKSVLVTAGASGIGSYIASSFLNAGAEVHIVDIDKDAVAEFCRNHSCLSSIADVSSAAEIEQVFAAHFDKFKSIDVLVNCAGIAGPTALVEDVDLGDWHRCFGVNLDATLLCSQQAIPEMKRKRAGRIINLSSTAGWHGYPLRSSYSAAKWAVIGLTKSMAMELGQHGVTANAICPGSVDGDRMDRVIAAEAVQKRLSEAEVRKDYTRGCSMRTFISGQDIADMALFLASDAASKVTGQIMNVDGHLESTGGLDDLGLS
jgi:NAD(P)-dependent dehydrogenase (short-subunit alcohol dehydrogenase family)